MSKHLLATRVRPWRLARLYRLAGMGIYDDELLLEVGWGFYARCLEVVLVARAVRGKVPCPACGEPVERGTRRIRPKTGRGGGVRCPECGGEWTWWDVKESLRDRPKCFHCFARLRMDYARNVVVCSHCARTWEWKRYRASVSTRLLLPCPKCEARLRRPPVNHERCGKVPLAEIDCPRCGKRAEHWPGRLRCTVCGHEEPWHTYRKREKRRDERLSCKACGYVFGWRAWRKRYRGRNLLTGKPRPAEAYLEGWRSAHGPVEQLHAIDTLVNAIHGRGAMGPLFIEGSTSSVMALLNRLADSWAM